MLCKQATERVRVHLVHDPYILFCGTVESLLDVLLNIGVVICNNSCQSFENMQARRHVKTMLTVF